MPPEQLVVVETEESDFVKGVRKASAEYWENEAKTAKSDASSSRGWAVSDATPSSVETLLESFLSAADTPVIEKVVWLPTVPTNHPLRKVDLFVTLWEPEAWNQFFAFVKGLESLPEDDPKLLDAFEKRFWFVIAVSTTNSSGKRVFTPDAFKAVYAEGVKAPLSVVENLIRKFDSPKYRPAMSSIFQAAMILNGLHNPVENRDGKKSEGTADTASSVAS